MRSPTRGEPRLAALASWLVLAASFGLSAATWIALAGLAGFAGQADVAGVRLHLAWLMPVAVDGYVVVALVLWMAPVPATVARFARANTYAAAGIGVAAQSAYHCLTVLAATGQIWRGVLAAVVGAMPPAVAALAVHMRALIRRESRTDQPAATRPPAPVDRVSDSTAELCDRVRAEAKMARARIMPPPAIVLRHRPPATWPPQHQMAARSDEPAVTVRPTDGHEATPDPADAMAAEPAGDTPGEPARKRPPTAAEAATRVGRMLARKPALTATDVAARLGVPDRTARRYLAAARRAAASTAEGA